MRAFFLLLGSFLLIYPVGDVAANQTTQANTSTVHIIPVDVYGTDLRSEAKVDVFKTVENGPNLGTHFRENSAAKVPYGIYRMRVHVLGFWSVEREIRVFQPEVWTVVALALGAEGGPEDSSISGHVENISPPVTQIRVRLSGIYSGDIMDTVVNNSGSFELTHVLNGAYILLTTQDEKVLDVRAIKVPTTGPIVIALGQTSLVH